MYVIKLVVLGSAGCGKSSLVRQFVKQDMGTEFSGLYEPTTSKQVYFPTVVFDDHIFEVICYQFLIEVI